MIFSKKFLVPEAAVQQHIAILGKTGSGKTATAKVAIVEPLLALGRRVGIVDPTDAWYGLRSSRDGKGPGFPILVLGGDHGDLPLPALGGAAVARLLVEQGISLVASTKHLTVGERTRWFIDFAGTISRLNRTPLHLVLDEAHNFAPQGKVPDPDTGKMLHAANTLASAGRSIGIRLVMITQRPQKLHKDTLTSADTLIAMRVLAPHDRAAVEDWIKGCGDPAQGKEVLNSLASLQRGEGWAWYPEGKFLERLKFPAIKTFDSSATPTDGHAIASPKGAADIDLTEIKAAMAEAVKEAEANDPKLLRAQVANLKRQLAGRAPIEKTVEKIIEIPVLKDGQLDRTEKVAARLEQYGQKFLAEAAELRRLIAPASALRPIQRPYSAVTASNASARKNRVPAERADISRSQQRILNALAWLESVRIERADKTQVALLADQSPTSGGYFNNLGNLRSARLIDYPAPSMVALTDAGRAAASTTDVPTTSEELQEQLIRRLSGSQGAILRKLIEVYPRELAKDDLAEAANQSPTSGGYFNNLGRLRTLGLINYPTPGKVVALPVLFLE